MDLCYTHNMDLCYTLEEICCVIERILKDELKIKQENLSEAKRNTNFLGHELGLNHRDLLYLYFILKEKFNVSIPNEDIAKGNFSSINKVAEIIYTQIQMKRNTVKVCSEEEYSAC